ncbi:MAG TPA: epoxyqueuosine reductase QueH, partial [Candidatus Woesebacteria bacterium]|nr:epoxyqueuosine reductase QueH [Candidatus Woesebacteria bacterium]HOG37582.1 epoxyqueuosine reductase QueH [Candidatus Woesebacteria bacterium]
MKILVHSCCADCLLKLVEAMKQESDKNLELTAYVYNPNIHPRSEYLSRLKAVQQIAKEIKIELVVADWSPKEWFEVNKNKFEKPERCH